MALKSFDMGRSFLNTFHSNFLEKNFLYYTLNYLHTQFIIFIFEWNAISFQFENCLIKVLIIHQKLFLELQSMIFLNVHCIIKNTFIVQLMEILCYLYLIFINRYVKLRNRLYKRLVMVR